MRRTDLLKEIRKMRFEEVYEGWNAERLTQGEAAAILRMSKRNLRRSPAATTAPPHCS